ncbi:NAD(P)-dependent oxidoreductase [Hydrogenophaga sp.]|uniref:NAD(P)-dependent oxidoreductase n=1 Tax=Hydrogenophaga sp. TaxID=1904254 RepID=UPI00271BEA13|nr:NAD(P)-dependent oxidoreductase [Hydrogenophaga sp.]MDO9437496.1 NAD(P)-dependent oxidoreductase [Hydrogenophaga sp.]
MSAEKTGEAAGATSLVVALLTPLPARLVRALEDAGYLVPVQADPLWHSATVAVTRGSLPTGDDVLAQLPQLALLCCWGSGYDGIDLQATSRRGIAVSRSAGGNSASVADLAMGFVIGLLRNLPQAQAHVASGAWHNAGQRLPSARGLTGTRIGVFGAGDVGRRILARARAFEMVLGCCSRRDPGLPEVRYFAQLQDLAHWCDVLVIAVRADASTQHAVNADVLRALGPDACLVNVARGSIVDEAALCAVLERRELAGFASDVFENEPAVPPAMLAFPNALLTPHVGGATDHAQQALVEAVMGNIRSFVATGRPAHPVHDVV